MNRHLLAVTSALLFVCQLASAQDTTDAAQHAKNLLKNAPLVDGHNDLPWVLRENFGSNVEGYDISVPAKFDTDIPRLRKGGVGVQFWSVYVPTTLGPLEAMRTQLEQIDIAHRLIERYPDVFTLATTADEVEAANANGRIASLIGMEGGHTIVNSLGALRSFYGLGVRYMTLTHFNGHDWADSATDVSRHDGLTPFGEEVVREMNRIGMIVDLSHVSVATMNDALDVTEAPVMFSHSSAFALTASPRNVPDDVLRRVATNNGVVMVTFIPEFVNDTRRKYAVGLIPALKDAQSDEEWNSISRQYEKDHGEPPPASLADVADHIDHVARVAGIDHVGIAGDFYGAEGNELVVGLEDVSKYPDLFAELIRRGWSDENLVKLSRSNMLRVLRDAQKVASRLQKERAPSLKTIEELDNLTPSSFAQATQADSDAILAVAESALQAITDGDLIALTDLMVDEAQMFPTFERNGVAGYAVRTREAQRSQSWPDKIVERGYDPEIHVSGTVASVWFPYDLYVNGEWSHCGADVFVLVRVKSDWRIASMAWSTEQPPACEPHPDGPPKF